MPWSQYPDLSPCNWLLQTDYAHMALAAGPLDVPLGPLQALSTFLPNDNSPLAAETESILKNLRGIQEQVRLNSSPVLNSSLGMNVRPENSWRG